MSGHAFKLCPALGLGAAELLLDGEARLDAFRYDRLRALRGRSRRSAAYFAGARDAAPACDAGEA